MQYSDGSTANSVSLFFVRIELKNVRTEQRKSVQIQQYARNFNELKQAIIENKKAFFVHAGISVQDSIVYDVIDETNNKDVPTFWNIVNENTVYEDVNIEEYIDIYY